jgi:ribonuclease HI
VNQSYRIFTDGSAIGNPGPGGWGAVLMQGKRRWEMSGAFPWTTISEMELVAAVPALRAIPDRARVELHSDSEYLIYGMRVFVFHWQRQGWRNRLGNQLQHRELWSELSCAISSASGSGTSMKLTRNCQMGTNRLSTKRKKADEEPACSSATNWGELSSSNAIIGPFVSDLSAERTPGHNPGIRHGTHRCRDILTALLAADGEVASPAFRKVEHKG